MRGIIFKTNNGIDKILSKIFLGIDLSIYTWKISEDEIYLYHSALPLLEEKTINRKEFSNLINEENYQVISANIRSGFQERELQEFNDYNEFYHSDCKLNLFCTDVTFFEVYVKDVRILEKIKSNCALYGFSDIEYVTDKNDRRTRFTIK